MAPTDSLRLRVMDRVVTILKDIDAGNTYFFTPYNVVRSYRHISEAKGFPIYMVFPAKGGGESGIYAGHGLFDEKFYFVVEGYVHDKKDPVKAIERALHDVRKAIMDDALSGAAGSLGAICVNLTIDEPPETDEGELSLDGIGWFQQRVMAHISGAYGEI